MFLITAFYSTRAQPDKHAVEVTGKEPVATVSKTVSQKLGLSEKTAVAINNNYGNVTINTWNKKSLLIKVVISASSKDPVRAAELLKSIHVDLKKIADLVTCVAAIGAPVKISTMNTPDTGKQRPITVAILPAKWCNVNFEVYLPATQPLTIDNMFGNIAIGDYEGPLSIKEQFGDLVAGNLSGPLQLDIQQGNMHVKHLNLGQININTFDHVIIDRVSGPLQSQFQLGRQLNITLDPHGDSVSLKASNVQMVNFSGVNPEKARYMLRLVFSKLQFNGSPFLENKNGRPFEEIHVDMLKKEAQRLDDSILRAHPELRAVPKEAKTAADILAIKTKKELSILALAKFKKMHEYAAGPENAKTQVSINVNFGTLNVMP